jgi:hypothetical protein
MSLFKILKGILNIHKKIETTQLPSQGFFYKSDFEIYIKKADLEDIIEYEYKYNKEDLSVIITRLKKIVEKNVILSRGYYYNDIKSIDIVYLFLEIVKFTNNKPITLYFFNDKIGTEEEIKFESSTFNYYKLDDDFIEKYNDESREFDFNGYKYSIPCIGVENSLTNFLISKSEIPGSEIYNNYTYDFIYFLGHKSHLTFDEIENLIQIFNFDMDENSKNIVRKIVKSMSIIGKYSLKKDLHIIDVNTIDLSTIWK